MATAPTIDAPAAQVQASSESQPEPSASSHVDHNTPVVNGIVNNEELENKHFGNVEEQLKSADASVSGGSDTEASRGDGSNSKDGDKSRGRTGSSAKKPATFKAVSVNRTFLASKANPTSVSPKPVEKASPSSSTPPPGSSGLSVPRPRLVAKTGSGSGSVPRYSTLNGGKPATAPDASAVWNKNRPPEPKKFTDEELKKYGIHMASRLNEDETSGQNKWADIDDDDDDWAPEAITWGDGTKTTLPHPDEHPQMPDSGAAGLKAMLQDKSGAPRQSTESSTPPPYRSAGLASGRGLVLKSGAQEKPTLVAKPPPPPGPAKSPWASLPPVDRTSPSIVEPSHSVHPQSSSAHYGQGMPPPREFAADDFSRSSWRDSAPHGNRELYNSQSGKYEPVPDRRGSFRSDQQPRHPAVLQRSHLQPADHPAEPSSAFQTHRSSQEVPYRRRRASSNVSGGSGAYFQRMARPSDGAMPPPELLEARRPSLASSGEAPLSPANRAMPMAGPGRHQGQTGWAPRRSPESSHASLRHSGQPAGPDMSGQAGYDTNLVSQPPPVQSQEDEIEFQNKLMKEKKELARKRREEDEAREEAERRARIQKKLEALGPAPEKKSDKKEGHEAAPKPTQIQQREHRDSTGHGSDATKPKDLHQPSVGKHGATGQQGPTDQAAKAGGQSTRRASHSSEAKHNDLWTGQGPRPERFTSWAPGASQPSRNVWGSPNNDRGLGNGTFNPDLGSIPGSTAVVGSNSTPSAIAPLSTARPPPTGPSQPAALTGLRASRYATHDNEVASKWVAGVTENDKKMSAARAAERVERDRRLAERGLTLDDVQPTIKDTWRPVHLPGDGTRQVLPPNDPQTHGASPWAGSREELARGAQPDAAPPVSVNPGVIGSAPGSVIPQAGSRTSSQPKTSRFFPVREAHGDGAMPRSSTRPNSPSPPPPTMEGHPVYEGDSIHPHVSLPRPQPVVKLPPAMRGAQATSSRPEAAWTKPVPVRDAVRGAPVAPRAARGKKESTQQNWQSRINSLLGNGKLSPPKSLGVDPSSKSALDHALQHDAATVSLPVSVLSGVSSRPPPTETKPMAEECFEEQEMGSLPQIRIPHKTPDAAWIPAPPHTKPLPKKFLVQSSIREPFYFAAEAGGSGSTLRIQFPGMEEAKKVSIPFTTTRGGRGGRGRSGPRHRGSNQTHRGGKREGSGSHEGSGTSGSGRGSRGAYRSRGSENWSRSGQAPAS